MFSIAQPLWNYLLFLYESINLRMCELKKVWNGKRRNNTKIIINNNIRRLGHRGEWNGSGDWFVYWTSSDPTLQKVSSSKLIHVYTFTSKEKHDLTTLNMISFLEGKMKLINVIVFFSFVSNNIFENPNNFWMSSFIVLLFLYKIMMYMVL